MGRDYIINLVGSMKAGDAVRFDARLIADSFPSFKHNDAVFTSADRVLENVMGSSCTHSYEENHMMRTVTFYRHHENSSASTYVSPDRR